MIKTRTEFGVRGKAIVPGTVTIRPIAFRTIFCGKSMSSAAGNRMVFAANRMIICHQSCETSEFQLFKTSRIIKIDSAKAEIH